MTAAGGGSDEVGELALARHAFARRWAEAITGTSYVPWESDELVAFVGGLLDRLLKMLGDANLPGCTEEAADVGADLVAAHFTDSETLSGSLMVLSGCPPELVPVDTAQGTVFVERLQVALSALAAGYATALRDRSLAEQYDIQRAMLVASQQTQARLAVSEARFRTMFDASAIGIGVGDLDGTITDANPALLRMFGYTGAAAGEFVGRNVSELVHPADVPSVWEAYAALIAGQRDHFRVEKRFFRRDGGIVWTNLTVSLVRDRDGSPSFQVALLEDITERRKLQADLEHRADHDVLTGLANRGLLARRMRALFDDRGAGARVGLCCLDVDHLKAVNDLQGHDVGDELLVALAERLLRRCPGPGHLVARTGGDEFVILVDDPAGISELEELAAQLREDVRRPIRVGTRELRVTASQGVVVQAVADTSPADLLSAGDIALYWAKRGGKDRVEVFDDLLGQREIHSFSLAAAMPAAVERGEFMVVYQPLVDLRDGSMRGVEALVRWMHPTFGLIAPDRFIGVAEESGAIVQLGRWVLHTACRQGQRWRRQFPDSAPFVSVNLSPRQLLDPGLVADVAAILADTHLPPDCLQLELTEQAVMAGAGPLRALAELRDLGIKLVLDDFGTGYSNLAQLRRLPVHAVKLDRSLAADLTAESADPAAEHVVVALIALARAMNLSVTAEGIETPAQLARLRTLGADLGQGWLLTRPASPYAVDAVLEAGSRFGLHAARHDMPPSTGSAD